MSKPEKGAPSADPKYKITIVSNGPYLVYGSPPITREVIELDQRQKPWSYRAEKRSFTTKGEAVALCRCGASRNAPYCDGTHMSIDWDHKLTAPHRELLDDAELIDGPTIDLTDNENYCAFARLCDAQGRTWSQVRKSADPEQRELAIRTANMCPSGRLKVWDKHSKEPIEWPLHPSIALIEDPAIHCSGPIWVRGGIPITDSTGYTYQPRNRVTLCRCGNSYNKPFCDGNHASSYYFDGIKPEDEQ